MEKSALGNSSNTRGQRKVSAGVRNEADGNKLFILEYLVSANLFLCSCRNIYPNTFSSFKANADANRLRSSQRALLLTGGTLPSATSVCLKTADHFHVY